jgi:hypothetical protein
MPCQPILITTMPKPAPLFPSLSHHVSKLDLINLTLLARALAKERPTAPVQARAHRDWTHQDAHGDVPERASTSPALIDLDHLLPSPLTCSLTSMSASPWTSPLARRRPVDDDTVDVRRHCPPVHDDRPPALVHPCPRHDARRDHRDTRNRTTHSPTPLSHRSHDNTVTCPACHGQHFAL